MPKLDKFTKVNGETTYGMAKAHIPFSLSKSKFKQHGRMDYSMGMSKSFTNPGLNSLDNIHIIKKMDRELFSMRMERFLTEFSKTIKPMDSGKLFLKIFIMKETLLMDLRVEKVFE